LAEETSSGAAAAGAGAGSGGSASARAESHGEHGAASAAPGTAGEGMTPSECRSTWHGKESERVDYQGRSWLEPPKVRRLARRDRETLRQNGRETGRGRGLLRSKAERRVLQGVAIRWRITCVVCEQQPGWSGGREGS
jgi:hypothetical protein